MEQKNEKKSFDLRGESKEFAVRSIKLYQYLTEKTQKKEYNLSKQFLISATRIGDFVRLESLLDAYHMARSSHYWVELLIEGGYINQQDIEDLLDLSDHLTRYLYVVSHPETRQKGKVTPNSFLNN